MRHTTAHVDQSPKYPDVPLLWLHHHRNNNGHLLSHITYSSPSPCSWALSRWSSHQRMWTRTRRWVSFLRLCPSILASSHRRGLACLVILACGTRGPLAPTPPGYSCLKMPANKVFVSLSNWILVHADDSTQTPDRPLTTKTLTFLPLVFSNNPNSAVSKSNNPDFHASLYSAVWKSNNPDFHATLPSAVSMSNNPNSQATVSVSTRETSAKYDFFEYYQPLQFYFINSLFTIPETSAGMLHRFQLKPKPHTIFKQTIQKSNQKRKLAQIYKITHLIWTFS